MYKIEYRNEAIADIREIMAWYEGQKENLGTEFRVELEERILLLKRYPKIAQVVAKNIRRIALKRFSAYGVFYSVNEQKQDVQILAIMHSSRNPKHWKNRQ